MARNKTPRGRGAAPAIPRNRHQRRWRDAVRRRQIRRSLNARKWDARVGRWRRPIEALRYDPEGFARRVYNAGEYNLRIAGHPAPAEGMVSIEALQS